VWSRQRRAAAPAAIEGLIPGFRPESELERRLAADPELLAGLAWGKARPGHPEGTVGAHVADLLQILEEWGEEGERRGQLRFIALVHDSQKNRVQEWRPRSGENHHAMRARRLAERYSSDERLLAAIELHDRPYALWRKRQRKGALDVPGFARMLERIPDLALFVRFVELDGSTKGKNPEPLRWLKQELRERDLSAG
jgi:hypothetical protein